MLEVRDSTQYPVAQAQKCAAAVQLESIRERNKACQQKRRNRIRVRRLIPDLLQWNSCAMVSCSDHQRGLTYHVVGQSALLASARLLQRIGLPVVSDQALCQTHLPLCSRGRAHSRYPKCNQSQWVPPCARHSCVLVEVHDGARGAQILPVSCRKLERAQSVCCSYFHKFLR